MRALTIATVPGFAAEDGLDAVRVYQLPGVDRVRDGDLREIHLDELGQVRRQARDLDLVHHVVDYRAGLLYRRRDLGVQEVQRHLHVDLLVRAHALEVDVLHLRLPRVHVDRPQLDLLLLAVEAKRDDRRVKRLSPRLQVELFVIELDRERRLGAAVEDAGHPAGVAQTAARTRSLRGALGSAEFNLHDSLQSLWAAPRPGTPR